ncbi:hypothetical protein EVAR_44034_1 [Eumeta japonica]|uniref:Uncharacterized protein n=1 Tax=Eumeta variegata TaxID=151549 RepID=A0A4C1XGB6_EUMVA|nr:hypothetical protein EVAR_44034_1 [Eumeta japonica]
MHIAHRRARVRRKSLDTDTGRVRLIYPAQQWPGGEGGCGLLRPTDQGVPTLSQSLVSLTLMRLSTAAVRA